VRSALGSPVNTAAAPPTRTWQYVLCGTMQFLVFLGYLSLYVTIATRAFLWVYAGTGPLDLYLRSVIVSGGVFLTLSVFPIVAKWILIGRWKPQQIRVWSLAYFRFWLVKTITAMSPLRLLGIGSPWYVFYLRALGARVGKGVVIFSPSVVCTDLLTIGDGTVIRKGSSLACYRARAGWIETGPVTLGRDVVISEATVLDIETSMGDRAQLGHASSLHQGQAVPADERWHGSPAQRTDVDYRAVPPARCGTLRRVLYPLSQLLVGLLFSAPLALGGAAFLVRNVPLIPAFLDSVHLTPASTAYYIQAAVVSLALMVGGLLLGLVTVSTVPRLVNLAIKPDKVYRLFGIHYFLQGMVGRLTNSRVYTFLFGDSFLITSYLRYIGYDLGKVVQTGSNFSTGVVHESPYSTSVGTGTVVADGLAINNADYSASSFRVARARIGEHNFLGNQIAYPSQSKAGNNCLLGTKVMVPIDGKVREGVGLLGSPSFEIPRSVMRDTSLEMGFMQRYSRLHRKNRHNVRTLALALLVRWILAYILLMAAMVITDLYRGFGIPALVATMLVFSLFTLAVSVVVENASRGFRPLRPQYCSIYDPYFWWHERFWKLSIQNLNRMFAGTPFKPILLRLLGVNVGRKVFDDGCALPEKTLVTIGDYCTLNALSVIQCHSQEDGAFKSDTITIGTGCTLGVGAWVHYGVTMGAGVVLAPDSFLMKGEQVPRHAHWGGNPAEELPSQVAQPKTLTPAAPSEPSVVPWSWELDAAVLDAKSRKNRKVVLAPASEEPWSWDLDAAALAADSPKRKVVLPRPGEEPWSWDLDTAALAPGLGRNRNVVLPPPGEQPWSWDSGVAAPTGSSGINGKPVVWPAEWQGDRADETPGGPGMSSRTVSLVRRGLGLAAVLVIVVSALAYYRVSPGVSVIAAIPSVPSAAPQAPTPAPSPSADAPSPAGSSSPDGPSPTTRSSSTPKPKAKASKKASKAPAPADKPSSSAKTIRLKDRTLSAEPFQTVRIQGTYPGAVDTLLQLQRVESGEWVSYPLLSKTNKSGEFTTFIELGEPGRYQLRVRDPSSNVRSRPIVLVITA
jgi:non-ribosomal peptide synthetase-like protein